ncbi:ABC transporter permease [Pseudonocardia ailaonensis]|uniref:ABC transporter permease n=1 Tax=Pseudonocardia ailaonensis TaxID=367279 RepID=A0ABN2N0C2_9PSEU
MTTAQTQQKTVAAPSSQEGRGVTFTPAAHESVVGARRRKYLHLTLRWATPVVLIALWQLAASQQWINTLYFPGPDQIFRTAISQFSDGTMTEAFVLTGWRTLLGFGVGAVIGFIAGVAIGAVPILRAAFEPVLYALWTIPKLALLPLLLLIFGLGSMPLIVLIILNTLFLVMIPTAAGIAGASPELLETARAFSASPWQLFRHVLLPSSLVEVFVSLKIASGAAILVAVATEFVIGGGGLGYIIWNSWQVFLPDRMYVGIVVVAVTGSAFTLLVGVIGRRMVPWAHGL